MPTYEYECLDCRHRFNVFQSMKDDSIKICEKCGKGVRKIFGAAGIIFKGNGFYVNDYKKNECPSSSNSEISSSKKESPATPCSSCNACPAS